MTFGPGKSLPSKIFLPLASRMSTSCGVPESLLSKLIWNGLSAGAASAETLNFTFSATIAIPPGAPDGGADAPAPAPPSPSAVADRGGNQPAFRATATTSPIAVSQRSAFGQP